MQQAFRARLSQKSGHVRLQFCRGCDRPAAYRAKAAPTGRRKCALLPCDGQSACRADQQRTPSSGGVQKLSRKNSLGTYGLYATATNFIDNRLVILTRRRHFVLEIMETEYESSCGVNVTTRTAAEMMPLRLNDLSYQSIISRDNCNSYKSRGRFA